YVVIDVFSNLDDFLRQGKEGEGVLVVLFDYYWPRTLAFFDYTSGLLALLAAVFCIVQMQRHNEFTALMASGLPNGRIMRMVLVGTLLLAFAAAANRELILPHPDVRDRLVRNAQNWDGERSRA